MSTLTRTETDGITVTRENMLNFLTYDEARIHRSHPAFCAGVGSMSVLLGILILGLSGGDPFAMSGGVSFGTLAAVVTIACAGVVGYVVGITQMLKKVALNALERSYRSEKEKVELAKKIKEFSRFPCGQSLKWSTSYVVDKLSHWTTDAGSATHNVETELVFTLRGVYYQSTMSPSANKVWDDALEAVTTAHGISLR